MRRYRNIIIGAVVIIAIVLATFWLFSRNQSPTSSQGTTGALPGVTAQSGMGSQNGFNNTGSGSLPSGNASQPLATNFGVVSNEPVLNYFVDASNTVVTVEPDGKIEEIAGNQSSYLSSTAINNVVSADFSYDGKKILVAFGNPGALQWSIFDIATKAWSAPSVSPLAAAWSPSNYQIAYLAKTGASVSLETIDTSNAKAKPTILISFPAEDFQILWRSPASVYLLDKSSALFAGSILSVNAKTGALSMIVASKVGLESQWNADGTLGLILTGTQVVRGGQLGIIDNGGNVLHEMSFLTLPSKCTFVLMPAVSPAASTTASSSATSTAAALSAPAIICGVPRDTSKLNNNPLPDAYEERMFMTSDDLYEISLTNGSVATVLADASQNLDVSNVKFFNNTLFFVNRYDQKLYALTL